MEDNTDKALKEEGFAWQWRPQRRHKFLDDPLFEEGDGFIGESVKQILQPPASCEEEEDKTYKDLLFLMIMNKLCRSFI